MHKAVFFIAEGFEEVEALTPMDLLKRAGVSVTTVSIHDALPVTGSHGFTFLTDICMKDAASVLSEADLLVLPGGKKGTDNLDASAEVAAALKKAFADGRFVGAICAAPSVLGHLGIASGRKVTSYPGFESAFDASTTYLTDRVVTDGNLITSRGMGTAYDFGLKLVELLVSKEESDRVAHSTMYIY